MLQTPRDQIPGHPATPAQYRDLLAAAAFARGRTLTIDVATLEAFVEFGRWIAACPYCNAGIAVHPDWDFAGCFGCFHVYASIAVPDEWRDIERVLIARPVTGQYWYSGRARSRFFPKGGPQQPSETVEDLLGENVERGVPVPPDLEPRVPARPQPVVEEPPPDPIVEPVVEAGESVVDVAQKGGGV